MSKHQQVAKDIGEHDGGLAGTPPDRMCGRGAATSPAHGFTLVELLVVIGIIALLISVLLPALSKARDAASRTKCLSNQRQVAQALYMYATEQRGAFPGTIDDLNASLTWYAWYVGYINHPTIKTDGGWFGLGLLYRRGLIKSPEVYYCPDMKQQLYRYPDGWHTWADFKATGYLYRPFTQAISPYVTGASLERTKNLRLGRFKGKVGLTMDIVHAWPHDRTPGVNVTWADGSGSWVQLGKRDYEASVRLAALGYDPLRNDHYVYFFWRALEMGDFTDFATHVNALNWSALGAKYPPL